MKTLFSTGVAAKVIADSTKPNNNEKAISSTDTTPVENSKPKKPRTKKNNKKVEPKVTIVNFEFNPINPKLGSIELDWNKEFVDLLKLNGYFGLTDEDVVNKWLSDVCRTIAMNDISSDNVRYIQRKDLGDGKTEVS